MKSKDTNKPLKRRRSVKLIIIKLNIIFRIVRSIFRKNPYKLTVFIVDGCNLRCGMCSIWENPKKFMDLVDFKNLIKTFPGDLAWLNLSGGEVTLHPDFSEFFAVVNDWKKPLMITVTSNGYKRISQKVIDQIQRNTKHFIFYNISLDGQGDAHDNIRGRAKAFGNAVETIDLLKTIEADNALFQVGINYTVMDENINSSSKDIMELVARYEHVNINPAQKSDYYINSELKNKINPNSSLLVQVFANVLGKFPFFSLETILKKNYFKRVLVPHSKNKKIELKCTSMESNIIVTADGEIKNCIPKYNSIWKISKGDLSTYGEDYNQIKTLEEKEIVSSGCEQTCTINCERYLHIISRLVKIKFL